MMTNTNNYRAETANTINNAISQVTDVETIAVLETVREYVLNSPDFQHIDLARFTHDERGN